MQDLYSNQQYFGGPGIQQIGLGFMVLGFRVQGLGSGFRLQGSGFGVQGLGLRVEGFGFRKASMKTTSINLQAPKPPERGDGLI